MKRRLLEALLVTVCAAAVLGQSNGPIRLWRSGTTSASYTSGRVQVYYNSRWGNICDQSGNFGLNEATVICHQLGYTGASSWSKSRNDSFGSDSSRTVLSGVSCSTSAYLVILQCRFDSSPASSCTNNDDVSVTCFSTRIWSSPYSGQIRLTGGSTVNQGLVEVYCSGQWGTVCDDLFGQFEANTVCRQLGYERAYDYDHLSIRGSTSQPIWLDNVPCSSSDVCLADCINCPSDENCGHSEDVTVECYSLFSYTVTNINTCRGRNTESVNLGAIIGGTIGGVIVLIIAIVIVRHILLQNKRQRGDWFAFNTTSRHSSRPNIIRAAVVTSTATTTSSQPVSTEPAQAPPPAPFDLPRPEAQGSVFTYNQPSNPTISDAPPPAYGTHDKYSSYNEKDEKSNLPPPYQPPYVDTAAAYPTAPQAYPPPGGYAYPPPTTAAYPPPGAAPYPPAPGDTAYPPPGGQGPNWGTAAYPPYPPQT